MKVGKMTVGEASGIMNRHGILMWLLFEIGGIV